MATFFGKWIFSASCLLVFCNVTNAQRLRECRNEQQRGGRSLYDDYMEDAKIRLHDLRWKGNTSPFGEANELRHDCACGGFALKDVGTSEKEVARLVRRGHTRGARKGLASLRHEDAWRKAHPTSGSFFIEWEVRKFLSDVAKSGKTLKKFGTSQKELDDMLARNEQALRSGQIPLRR